jgi:hypothetical protein
MQKPVKTHAHRPRTYHLQLVHVAGATTAEVRLRAALKTAIEFISKYGSAAKEDMTAKALQLAYWKADRVRGRKPELDLFFGEQCVDISLLDEMQVQPIRSKDQPAPPHRSDSRRRQGDPSPLWHRSLQRASPRLAAPGEHCLQTSK